MTSCTWLGRQSVAAAFCLVFFLLLFAYLIFSLLFCFTSLLKHVILFFSLLFYFLALANEKVEDINGCPRSQSQMVRIIFILNIMLIFTSRFNCICKWTRKLFCMTSCLFKKSFKHIIRILGVQFMNQLIASVQLNMYDSWVTYFQVFYYIPAIFFIVVVLMS